ncbi:hypothetical protein PRIPAC_78363, partial [Pristionchus pacificus]
MSASIYDINNEGREGEFMHYPALVVIQGYRERMGVTVAKPCKAAGVYARQDTNPVDSSGAQKIPDPIKVNVTVRDVKAQVAISTIIDKSLQREKTEDLSRVKILLLGGADAGKSTILKQM